VDLIGVLVPIVLLTIQLDCCDKLLARDKMQFEHIFI